jgi:hypothetical protein
LKDVLVVESSNRLGWKELVAHPLFRMNQENNALANEFRISLELKVPDQADEREEKDIHTI